MVICVRWQCVTNMDTARQELLAVILSSSPVPPLALMVIRSGEGEQRSEDSFSSSHDVLAAAMIHVMQHGTEETHLKRKQKQIDLLYDFHHKFVHFETQDQENGNLHYNIYNGLCGYTRNLLATYDPLERPVEAIDIRFEQYWSVQDCKKGESLFDATYDHLSSLVLVMNHQNSESGIIDPIIMPDAETMTYNEMLHYYYLYAWM